MTQAKQIKTTNTIPTVIILAGKTGGPLIPLLAIDKNLSTHKTILFGVRKGFEVKLANSQNLPIYFLPEVKLHLLSFAKLNPIELIIGLFLSVWSIFAFGFSCFIAMIYLLKIRPQLILSAGSFLAVPVLYTLTVLNKVGILDTKVIIHQQDPKPGISNRLTSRLATIGTVSYQYTKDEYPQFSNYNLIPNPLDIERFALAKDKILIETNLQNFYELRNLPSRRGLELPILLIFGGGSGAQFINNWVWDNIDLLTKSFDIIHLIGGSSLAKESTNSYKLPINYLQLNSLLEDMPRALVDSDIVLCRSGLSSITELEYLGKPACLIPIPGSHQELNAKLVADKFTILDQSKSDLWLDQINQTYLSSKSKSHNWSIDTKIKLEHYYQKVSELFNS